MKNRFLTRIFSVVALLVVSLVAVGCAIGGETSQAREKAKEQVNTLLSIDFGETNGNTVLEVVTGNIGIATDEDSKVSEEDLANNTYSEFAGGVVAEYKSSHPEIMDAQWIVSQVRDYQYAEDGTTVIGITKKAVYNLVFVVNRPEVDTEVTITITGSKVYEDQGIEYKYTKSREIVFTVAAKQQLEAVEMTIAEINEYANANWDSFSKNGIVDAEGNKVQVVTTGVVTEVLWGDGYTNHSFMISDGSESFYVYAPKGDVVELGDLVQVVCTPTYYYSIIETSKDAQVTVLLNGQEVPEAKEYTVDEWYAAYPNGSDFHDCPGQRVVIEGVLKHNGLNYIIESSETGKKFEVYYKGYTAYEESLIAANLGKLVKMEAAIYDYHSQGYYRLLANVYDYPMEVLTLSGQEALDADVSTIPTEFTVEEGATIELPTSLPNGSVIGAWSADKAGHIDLNSLVCTLNGAKETVVVTLTAKVTNGALSKDVSVVVTIKYVPAAQKEYVLADKLEVGVPYKYVVDQTNVGKVLYFAGAMDAQGKYFASSEVPSEGVDVYLEAADGGYYMYFLKEGVKTYMNMVSDGTKLCLEAAPSNVWVQNDQYNTFFTTVAGVEYYVGMYSTYETFSRSKTSYLANAGQCPARFYVEKDGSSTPDTPEVPEGQISLKEAIEIASKQDHNTYTTEKYIVTGTVSDLYNTVYGNMHLIDAEGNDLTIYGLYIEGSKYGDYAGTKPVEGDVITVEGVLGTYNGKPQMKNADLVIKGSEPEVPTPEVPEGQISLKEAIEIANKQAHNTYTTEKYIVTGTVSDLYNTVYGNMHLIDAEGNDLTIYGLYIEGSKYGDYAGTKPVEGDVITVEGVLGTYNGKPQMKNADLVIKGSEPEVPTHEHTVCPVCGKCEAADCTGSEEEKCPGHSTVEPSENTTVKVSIADYAAANGWENSKMYNELVMDANIKVTVSAVAGSGSYGANTGKYYTSGNQWRAYQADTEGTVVIAASNGLQIVSVKITYASQNTGSLVLNGANIASDTLVEVNAASVTFTIGNTGTATNGQARITAIEVVYGAGSTTPEVPTHEHTACPVCGKCEAADCTGSEEEKCAGHEVTPEVPEGQISLKEAIEIANKQAHNTYTTEKYIVTGTVTDLYNTVYGNMHLIDAEGNDLTIYGLYIEGSKYGDYAGTKPVEGDVITVEGVLGTYNGKPQMKNADLVVKGSEPEVPTHEHTACPVCGKCEAADCTGSEEEKCPGHSTVEPSENTTVKVSIADYAAANGWQNSTMYNELVMDANIKVTVSAVAGSGSYGANTGKYYTSGNQWRAYQADTEGTVVIAASNGQQIVSVKITYVSQNTGSLVLNGANIASDTLVEVNAASVTFSIGNTGTATNGQVRITAIEVVYGAGSTTPEVPTHEHTACETCGKCTAADCTGSEEEKCAGHPVHEHTACETCGKCTAEDCTGSEEEKCAGHEAAPVETTYTLDCVSTFGTYASAWDNSYKARTITFAELGVADLNGQLVLSNANKQTGTITDRPVMASKSSATQYATLTVESGTISSVTFTLAQWTTKKFKTLTIEYTTDGSTWVATNVGLVNGTASQADAYSPLSATLPEGVVGVRFAFLGSSTSNNQVGLTSVEFTHKA